MNVPTAKTKQILNAMRSGMSQEVLLKKYGLSPQGLHNALKRLSDAGLITEFEFSSWTPGDESANGDDATVGGQGQSTCRVCGCPLPDGSISCQSCKALERSDGGTLILDAADLADDSMPADNRFMDSDTWKVPIEIPHFLQDTEIPGPFSPELDLTVKSDESLLIRHLFRGAHTGDSAQVKYALDRGVDVNSRSGKGFAALARAACEGHVEIAELLLAHGAEVEACDPVGNTALTFAAGQGHADLVEALLAHGADLHARNVEGNTALIVAAGGKSIKTVKVLVGHGSDVCEANNDGITPLIRAAKKGSLELAALLISCGAEINAATRYGDTPLMTASFSGHTRCGQLLIRFGADVNRQNAFGHTALMKSAFKGRILLLTLLLGAGADPTVRDNMGSTAAHMAAVSRHEDIRNLLESMSHVYSLLHGIT